VYSQLMGSLNSKKERKMANISSVDEEYTSDLAMYWYFLSMQFDAADTGRSDDLADELIKHGAQLKKLLRLGGYTQAHPLSISVGDSVCFDIWLNAMGNIQVGKLSRCPSNPNRSLH
jgi:hypothetical protein